MQLGEGGAIEEEIVKELSESEAGKEALVARDHSRWEEGF